MIRQPEQIDPAAGLGGCAAAILARVPYDPDCWLALTLGWLDMKNLRGFGYACELVVPEVASERELTAWRDAVGVETLDIGVLYQPGTAGDLKLRRRGATVVVDLTRSGDHLQARTEEELLTLARTEVRAVLEQVGAHLQPKPRP